MSSIAVWLPIFNNPKKSAFPSLFCGLIIGLSFSWLKLGEMKFLLPSLYIHSYIVISTVGKLYCN